MLSALRPSLSSIQTESRLEHDAAHDAAMEALTIGTAGQNMRVKGSRPYQKAALLLAVLLIAGAGTAEEGAVTKLAPEPLIVLADAGKGSALVVFKSTGAKRPTFQWTDATGSGVISSNQIHFTPERSPQAGLLLYRMSVDTDLALEQNVSYAGKLLAIAPNEDAQSWDFSIIDKTKLDFVTTPTGIDVTLGPSEPAVFTIDVRNTGNSPIVALSSSGIGVSDGKHRSPIPATCAKDAAAQPAKGFPLPPRDHVTTSICLPTPIFAGTYTGQLDLTANGMFTKSLPLTVKTRGPYGWTYLPFGLFLGVLVLAFGISTALDKWLGGGLQRSQALLEIRRAELELSALLNKYDEWNSSQNGTLANGAMHLRSTLRDHLQDALTKGNETAAQLAARAQALASTRASADLLWFYVQEEQRKYGAKPEDLVKTVHQMDQLRWSAALDDYRNRLEALLTGQTEMEHGAAVSDGSIRSTATAITKLSVQIAAMAWLYHALVVVVVFLVAFETLYAPKTTFGSATDYIGVFLWSLGLTAAGKQVIQKAQSSAAR